MQILVVENDPRMSSLLRQAFTEEGYQVAVAVNGIEGWELARSQVFDVMVLDIMLPGLDGISIVKRLRERKIQSPVIFLTARDAPADIVLGLNGGADDYLTKPFSVEELLARVRAAARRGPAPQAPILRVEDLSLDPGTRVVMRGERQIRLTRTEFAMLETLMRRAGKVVTRDTLIENIWGHNAEVESNTLDAFVRLLRAKVDPQDGRKLIHTVRGIGYVIRSEA